jgi:hypothetical protein
MRLITWPNTDACVEWPHARTKKGYGQTYRYGKTVYVSRVVWEMVNGRALLPGEEVRHSCDNPPCYNPRHLLVGSRKDNMQDAVERQRLRFPKTFPPEVVTAWIERYRAGESSAVLAQEYGCHVNSVTAAMRRVDPALTRSQHGRRRWKMPGHEHGKSIKKSDEYEALKKGGASKSKAAAISNEAAKGPEARSKMAKKAAATRKRKGS